MKSIDKQIFLISDHPMMIGWLSHLIRRESGLQVSSDANSFDEAIAAIPSIQFDLIILDMDMNGLWGTTIIHRLNYNYPKIKILAVSSHDDPLFSSHCLRAGARGYIHKHAGVDDFKSAIKAVLNQKVYASDQALMYLLSPDVRLTTDADLLQIDQLCAREFSVFELLGIGLGPSQISNELKISVKTVESYTDRIKKKLQIKSNRELVQYAIRQEKRCEYDYTTAGEHAIA